MKRKVQVQNFANEGVVFSRYATSGLVVKLLSNARAVEEIKKVAQCLALYYGAILTLNPRRLFTPGQNIDDK